MKAKVVGQLGMECGHEHVALPCHDRVAIHLRQHLDPVAGVLDPGRADEDRPQRLVPEALHVHVLLEAADLAPERVAAGLDVHQAQVGAIEHDQSRAGAEHGPSLRDEAPDGLVEAVGLDPILIVVLSPPGRSARQGASRCSGRRTSTGTAPRRRNASEWAWKPP